MDTGKCEQCGGSMDKLGYFTNQKTCKKCCDANYKKVTGHSASKPKRKTTCKRGVS